MQKAFLRVKDLTLWNGMKIICHVKKSKAKNT